MLWIVTTILPAAFFAGTDQEDTIRFKELYMKDNASVPDIFIKELPFSGKEYVHPDDPNKILRLYMFEKVKSHAKYIQTEQAALQKLDAKSSTLQNEYPINQALYLC